MTRLLIARQQIVTAIESEASLLAASLELREASRRVVGLTHMLSRAKLAYTILTGGADRTAAMVEVSRIRCELASAEHAELLAEIEWEKAVEAAENNA